MTNEQILKKAIEKAVENGWDYSRWKHYPNDEEKLNFCKKITLIGFVMPQYYNIIFSHSFAKAFWGERYFCGYCGSPDLSDRKEGESHCDCEWWIDRDCKEWQYHLQQMVLEENPLSYIEKFL